MRPCALSAPRAAPPPAGRPSRPARPLRRPAARHAVRPPAAAPPAAPQSPAGRDDVAAREPTFRVAGTLASPAPPATAWDALTDYAAAPSIFASVAACRELGPPPADARAGLATPLPADAVLIEQSVGWSFLVFGGAFSMTLAVAAAPPPPGAPPGTRALAFDLVRSRYLASFRGLWTVAPADGGGCAVTHELAVTPRAAPPAAIRGVVQALFRKQVAALLADLEAELERRAAAAQG